MLRIRLALAKPAQISHKGDDETPSTVPGYFEHAHSIGPKSEQYGGGITMSCEFGAKLQWDPWDYPWNADGVDCTPHCLYQILTDESERCELSTSWNEEDAKALQRLLAAYEAVGAEAGVPNPIDQHWNEQGMPHDSVGCVAAGRSGYWEPCLSPLPPSADSTKVRAKARLKTDESAQTISQDGGDREAARPNIVFFLTDDLDLMLGGMDQIHQPKHIPALRKRGAEVQNWFAHTPVCCPSRSEIITGKMFHNLALTHGPNDRPMDRWNTDGHGHPQQCMYINETALSPGPTVFEHLGAAGWAVGVFGKYLNLSPRSGSTEPEPWSPGLDNSNPVRAPTGVHTYFVNPGPMAKSSLDASGEYYPAWYLLGSPSFNGTYTNGVASGPPGNRTVTGMLYETDMLARHATKWLRNVTAVTADNPSRPFFAYIAPHGPHGAALPAPEHAKAFPNVTAPRNPLSWNFSGIDHHWLVKQQPPVREHEVVAADAHFRRRWQCMLSVDELVGAVIETMAELSVLSHTYIFFSSDHGFHFHELRLGVGKWNVYDTDTRVPMLVSGPGIHADSVISTLVGSHIDLAATWLALAGLQPAPEMDGVSLLPSLLNEPDDPTLPMATRTLLHQQRQAKYYEPRMAYIEYHGLGNVIGQGRLMDCFNNTYRALRFVNHSRYGDLLYAEFGSDFLIDEVVFVEAYNMTTDPWSTNNIATVLDAADRVDLSSMATELWSCSHASCVIR